MRPLALPLLTLLLASGGCSPQAATLGTEAASAADLREFDATLAEALGADAYGMRLYVMAFLKAGPNQQMPAEEAAALQEGHMAHIRQLAEAGDLILAGPFVDGGDLRGIFLFNTTSVERARELTALDPAVAAGRLEMDLYSWYGSAALFQVPEIHARIARENP